MDQNTIDEGKTMAIISYITVIGLIIAYFMNNGKNNAFAKFHIGQSFRIFLFGIILSILSFVLVMVTGIGAIGYIGYLAWVLIILGIINAVNGKATPVPLIGTIGGK